MALTVCAGCQRHVRDGEGCPFCAGRPRTTAHIWKSAVLTAMMPLGLAACYGVPQTPGAADAGAAPNDAKVEPMEDSAIPDPTGHDPAEPDTKPDTKPDAPGPPQDSAGPDAAEGGDNTKPEGTDTPVVPDTRPARKYGAPPRPDVEPAKPIDEERRRRPTKYGAPPKPELPSQPPSAPKKP